MQVINGIESSVSCRVRQLFGVALAERQNFLELIHYGSLLHDSNRNTFDETGGVCVGDAIDYGVVGPVDYTEDDDGECPEQDFDLAVKEFYDADLSFEELDKETTYVFSDNVTGNGKALAKFLKDNSFGKVVETPLCRGSTSAKVRTWLWTYNGKGLTNKLLVELRELQGFKTKKKAKEYLIRVTTR